MRAVVYTLTLREPLLATSLQGDPNSSVSLSYVPGSLVRGALIQHYLRTHPQLKHALLDNDDARRLFIDGGTRYLHAYPLTDHGQRALPTPRALLSRKHDELDPNDRTSTVDVLDTSHPECGAATRARFEQPDPPKQPDTLKPLRAPFCAAQGETLYTYRPERTIAVHIQRNPVKGRSLRNAPNADEPTADGAVFRYDALAPEQLFQGVVLADNDADADAIKALLEDLDTCWLGRSRSAHYGKTSIGDVSIEEDWREYRGDEAGASNLFSITLLSEAVLRDHDGRPTVCLDKATLAAYLGREPDQVTIDEAHSFSATSEVGGFNRYWKLPLAQEYALAAGSVVSFQLTQPLSAGEVTELEQQGIGARRAEGFGRVAFNWRGQLERKIRKGALAKDTPVGNREVTTKHATALAQRMARQLYERSVEQYIVEFVKNNPVSQVPTNSQFGRLRVMVRQALPNADIETVRERFGEFKPTARSQYERARLGNISFDEWITQLLDHPDNVWNQQFNAFPEHIIAGQSADRNDRRVTLQLLAAVLAAPTRDQREQEEQL